MVVRCANALILFLLILTAVPTVSSQDSKLGSEEGPLSIAWEAVDGVSKYRIEVSRDNLTFIDTELEKPELRLNLAPGEYSYRVRTLNPFGGEEGVSGWLPLKVESARKPLFRISSALEIWEGEDALLIDIETQDIRDGTNFSLRRGKTVVPGKFRNNQLSFDRSSLESGEWSLIALDPSGKQFEYPEKLTVRPIRAPIFESIQPDSAEPEGLLPVEIHGRAFDPQLGISFLGPDGELPVSALKVEDGKLATVYLVMDDVPPGDYSLKLSNPSGAELLLEDAFQVVLPPLVEKIPDQPRFEFHAGLAPFIVSTGEFEIPSLLNVEMALLLHSGWTAPVISGFGIELRGVIGTLGPEQDMIFNNLHWSTDISGYWRPLVHSRIAPVLLLGVGNRWWSNIDDSPSMNFFFIRTSFAMDIIKGRQLVRIGINCDFAFTSDEPAPMVGIEFRRGFRF